MASSFASQVAKMSQNNAKDGKNAKYSDIWTSLYLKRQIWVTVHKEERKWCLELSIRISFSNKWTLMHIECWYVLINSYFECHNGFTYGIDYIYAPSLIKPRWCDKKVKTYECTLLNW